jgi:hypothetical protein
MRIFMIMCMVLLFSGGANAQTAEESVLFMLFGYEKSNPKLLLDGHASLRRVSDCKYVLTLDFGDGPAEVEMDFSNLQQYVAARVGGPNMVRPSVLGIRLFHFKGVDKRTGAPVEGYANTLPEVGIHLAPFLASADRMEKAAAYFRTTFCKGRAF